MADTLNQVQVTMFADMVNMKAQQTASFFKGRVLEAPCRGKRFEVINLEQVSAGLVTSRFQKVALTDAPLQRRGALVDTYSIELGFTESDQLQSIVDLESPFVDAVAKAMMREYDRKVARAAIGTVLTGEDFTTSTSFTSDGGTTVTASSGLVFDKVREVLQKFYARGVGLTADEELYLAITDKEHSTLLSQAQFTSQDYAKDFVVVNGKVTKVLGMNVIQFPSSPTAGSSIINAQSATVNNCFAFAKSGIKVGMNSDIEVKVTPRPDLVETMQVQALFRLAAIRVDGAKVVQIDVTNS